VVQKLGLVSSRLTSDSTRAIYADTAYGAFGEPYAQSDQVDLSFTGQNRDTVTNLYDFSAREYGTQGRWPSPDPAGTASAIPTDPQTWNRYAYVRNSPLSMLDPSGLDGMDYYDLESDNFDWEGNFGWGTSYTMNGLSIPASVAQGLLGNPDAASPCITCQSPGVGLDQYGIFQQTLRDYIQIQCTMFSDGDVCFLAPKGRNYLQVINPNEVRTGTHSSG
jgi:RHS repeat-associated protein